MRQGKIVSVNDRAVKFSFWPRSQETNHRRPIQSTLFSNDPWLIMKEQLKDISEPDARLEATSYMLQAEDLYNSAIQPGNGAAKPVQLYYCYLNLIKSYIKYYDEEEDLSKVRHGVNEAIDADGYEIYDAFIQYWHSPNGGKVQALDAFHQILDGRRPQHGKKFPLVDIIPQILPGHRLWASAKKKKERFVSIESIQFVENKTRKKVWLRLYLYSDDRTRLGHTQSDLLLLSGLKDNFDIVVSDKEINGRKTICFELKRPLSYSRHGSDKIEDLVQIVKPFIWATIGSVPPYRRYYLYLIKPEDRENVVSQILSIYMLTFYLGSITRYRPNVYDELMNGDLGGRINDFISSQHSQFIYLFASEFIGRDVSKPSIV